MLINPARFLSGWVYCVCDFISAQYTLFGCSKIKEIHKRQIADSCFYTAGVGGEQRLYSLKHTANKGKHRTQADKRAETNAINKEPTAQNMLQGFDAFGVFYAPDFQMPAASA